MGLPTSGLVLPYLLLVRALYVCVPKVGHFLGGHLFMSQGCWLTGRLTVLLFFLSIIVETDMCSVACSKPSNK